MPEISRFLGIVIYMYFNDHNPSHFHVKYNEYRASIKIGTLETIDGNLPAKVKELVLEWARMHQDELQNNWQNLQNTGKYDKIEPLV